MSKFDEIRTYKVSVEFSRPEYLDIDGLAARNDTTIPDLLRFLGVRTAVKPGETDYMFDINYRKEINMANKNQARDIRIQVLCSPTEYALINATAQRVSMTMSSFLRYLGMRVATDVTAEKTCLSSLHDTESGREQVQCKTGHQQGDSQKHNLDLHGSGH